MGCAKTKLVESGKFTVVCYEDHNNCNFLCSYFSYCTKPLQFEADTAVNHRGLLSLNYAGAETGASKIKQKFNDIHDELKKVHMPIEIVSLGFMIIWIVLLITFSLLLFLSQIYQVQCRYGKVCSTPGNGIEKLSSGCPKRWGGSWADDCCYAFCEYSDPPINGNIEYGKDECEPNRMINQQIREGKPFDQFCECKGLNTHEKREEDFYRKTNPLSEGRYINYEKCGNIKIYGDFRHLPGYYASPNFRKYVSKIICIIALILLLIQLLFSYLVTRMIKNLLNRGFEDWMSIGITVEYNPARTIERLGLNRNEYTPGHLILQLPSQQVLTNQAIQSNISNDISNFSHI